MSHPWQDFSGTRSFPSLGFYFQAWFSPATQAQARAQTHAWGKYTKVETNVDKHKHQHKKKGQILILVIVFALASRPCSMSCRACVCACACVASEIQALVIQAKTNRHLSLTFCPPCVWFLLRTLSFHWLSTIFILLWFYVTHSKFVLWESFGFPIFSFYSQSQHG